MKRLSVWAIAAATSLVSLIVICIFDFILSLIYYLCGKVPFLETIIDFIGEILDLGLTALVAIFIAGSIWEYGHSLTEKITGQTVKCEDGQVSRINRLFFFVFLAIFSYLGYGFVTTIGEAVTLYTSGYEGFTKILLFFEAIKYTFSSIRSASPLLYQIGFNSLILFIINLFFFKDEK